MGLGNTARQFSAVSLYHLVTFLKFPDFGTRYPTLELSQAAPSGEGKLSVFAETLWGEQKLGLPICGFLCVLLPKLMIMGPWHSLSHSPPHSPQEITPCIGFPGQSRERILGF